MGKVYRTLPDVDAEAHNMVRVVDEDRSDPDAYLYPAPMFAPIELPEVAERALMATSDSEPQRRRLAAPVNRGYSPLVHCAGN